MYETAVASPGQGKNARALRMKVMVRCRAHVDLVFIEGAKKYEAYEVLCQQAIMQGQEKPEPPTPAPYQQIKSQAGDLISYLPDHFANQIFTIGGLYQTMKITLADAINQTQAVADRLWLELDLSENFEVVRFLRTQAEEQAEGDAASEGDSDEAQ